VALVLLVVVAVLLLRSHPAEPSQPAADVQPAPAMTALPPSSPAPVTQSSSTAMTALPPASPASATQSSNAAMVKGDVAERVLPDVPEKVRATIHGKVPVSIRVKVDPDGKVSNAAVDSQGPSKYFAKAALQAAQQWRFKPAQVNGQAVSSVWVLHFVFGPAATEITPVRTSP
jgi:protein TonB